MARPACTTLENTDGCAEQYIYVTTLYLISMLAYAYNIIIDRGDGAPGHGGDFFDGLNTTEKWFLSMLMEIVKVPGAED